MLMVSQVANQLKTLASVVHIQCTDIVAKVCAVYGRSTLRASVTRDLPGCGEY